MGGRSVPFLLFYVGSIWAFCRAYDFCLYVLHYCADPSFRDAGLLDLLLHLRMPEEKGLFLNTSVPAAAFPAQREAL